MLSKRLQLTLALFALCSFSLLGQDYKIKGVVEDTLGNALIASTVLLLEATDSTMLDFTQSELDGSFRFKNVPPGNHLVKTTYIGYVPVTVNASSSDGSDINLGTLKMSELAEELMEVVIKAAKAPIKMKGDTIEYDASTFQVPEGSSVEELLRRLPGIEVESDGSITSDGKDITQVTVDGKSFFGNNTQAATKNLPAEGISKVQVFDSKTEEQEITGASTSSQDKTMNLEMKDEFKKGGFGKVVAGIGDRSRAELKGNYNKFNDKIQFSLVGVGNNTGRNGLGWDDYQDFLGSNTWGNGGSTDYGFGGSSGHYISWGGGDLGIESTIQNLFFSGERTGFPENYSGGINFNYDHNKTKINSVYYYNQNGLTNETDRIEDRFFQNFTQSQDMNSSNDDISRGHRAEVTFEKELDSLHTIKLDVSGAYIDNNELYSSVSNLQRDGQDISNTVFSNNSNTTGSLVDGLLVFRKKFKKKGRAMGLNVSALSTALEEDWTQESRTIFTSPESGSEDILDMNQDNLNDANKVLYKANALYVEPLGKKFVLQTFYNFRNRNESGDRIVNDLIDNQEVANVDLSRTYDNTIRFNRTGASLRYSANGTNVTLGGGYQRFDLLGTFTSNVTNEQLGEVNRTFDSFIPYFSVELNPARNLYIDFDFTRNPNEPSITDLQPLVNNINPLYIREGNPELTPEVENRFSTYISNNFPSIDLRISANASYSIHESQFSTNQTVDERLVTRVNPINVSGGRTASVWSYFSLPIIKNKLKFRVNYSFSNNIRPSFINGEENNTRVNSHSPSLRIDITPSKDYSIYLNSSYSAINTTYDIATSQDQKIVTLRFGTEVNAKLFAGFFLSTSYNVRRFSNDRFGQETTIPILNASIYRRFMKKDQLELRFSLYDGLNQNRGFNLGAFGNSVSQSETTSLSRYGMLSATFNIRGMKSDVRKNSWW